MTVCNSWSFLLVLLFLSATIVFRNLEDAALLPGFYLAPVMVLFVTWWRKLRKEIPMDLVIKNFAFGFLPVVFAMKSMVVKRCILPTALRFRLE